MRPRILALLRDERGQSLVLFVVSFMALMSILALLVNLGSWLQSKERLRIVADATALEAAQLDHDTLSEVTFEAPNAAQTRANLNWPGSALTAYDYRDEGTGFGFRRPDKPWLSIEIEIEHEVGYLLEGLLNYLNISLEPLIFEKRARVRIDSPEGLAQVAPIALKCPSPCDRPFPGWTDSLLTTDRTWPLDPQSGVPDVELFYRPGDLANSDFVPMEPFGGATIFDFQNIVQSCNPIVIGTCGMDIASTPTPKPFLDPGPFPEVAAAEMDLALESAGDWNHLVTVFDNDPTATGDLNIIGFAAFKITSVELVGPTGGAPLRITGTFHKMFYDNARLLSTGHAPEGGAYDFGVRTIAYSGPRDRPVP
jgi:hypothetical protein